MAKKVTSLIGLLALTILICVAFTPTAFADVPSLGIQSSMLMPLDSFQAAAEIQSFVVPGPFTMPASASPIVLTPNLYGLITEMEIWVAETSRSGPIVSVADLWCNWFLWCPLD